MMGWKVEGPIVNTGSVSEAHIYTLALTRYTQNRQAWSHTCHVLQAQAPTQTCTPTVEL